MTQTPNPSPASIRSLWCCGCNTEVLARITSGAEIYPHRRDLHGHSFWRCDACGGYVGCHHRHHDQESRQNPLGNIPTAEMRTVRSQIHAILDPLWKSGKIARGTLYERLSECLGRQFHTGELRTMDEARIVYREAQQITHEVS